MKGIELSQRHCRLWCAAAEGLLILCVRDQGKYVVGLYPWLVILWVITIMISWVLSLLGWIVVAVSYFILFS